MADLSNLQPVGGERDTIRSRSLEAIRNLILSGGLPPGSRINEVELASTLKISRGPVREAIQRLGAEGLVRIVDHRGAFVREFEADEIVALFELRTILESAGAELAAERRSPADVRRLARLLDDTATLLEVQDDAYPQDLDFHLALVGCAGNPALSDAAHDVHQRLRLARLMSSAMDNRARRAHAEHADILAAIERGDAAAAGRLMSEHLGEARRNALALFG